MRPILTCLVALLVTAPAQAAEPPPANAEAIRAHVAFLADDLLEGRATGSRGYDIAARYVATQMAVMGLKPAGAKGDWLQPVSLLQATRVIPPAQAVITRGAQQVALAPVDEFLPSPGFFGPQAEVEAPLVFVGYGISAPAFGHDDFAGLDLRGKIAVVLDGSPDTLPSSQRAHHAREKTREIESRGAVGIVTVQTPERAAKSPWEKSVLLATIPSRRLLDEDGQPVEAHPGIRASLYVNTTAAAKLFEGGPKPLEQVWADAEADLPQGFDLPASLRILTKTALSRMASANVVGLLEGADPALRNEYVVFTAHLDHLGRGTAVNGDAIYNGALDNASGVAVMLEAARLIAAGPRPRRSILFVAVTAEENGLLGSKWFAQNPPVPRDAIVANVNMDMPVLLYPAAGFTAFGAEHSTLGEVARRATEAEGLQLVPDQTPDEVLFVRSDQYSFVREGIPALYLDDAKLSSDPSVDPEAVFREHLRVDYHMPSDDMSLPIHWPSMAALARVNARIGIAIADDPQRPSWLPGDFFGETFGRQ
jgi:Zn-dependent M28 family amino/carboxypeptidase